MQVRRHIGKKNESKIGHDAHEKEQLEHEKINAEELIKQRPYSRGVRMTARERMILKRGGLAAQASLTGLNKIQPPKIGKKK